MAKTSIIIPTRNETYKISTGQTVLERTVQDIYENATGEIEVIVAFDGEPYIPLPDYKKLVRLEMKQVGSKPSINVAAEIATGKYLMKVDAHCQFAKGFDEVLQADMEENWVVTPRFYVLDAYNWKWQDDRFYDYFFLPCPFTDKSGVFRFQAGGHWKERTRERISFPIDENIKLHGSCFFMERDYFMNCLGGLHSDGAGTWAGEDIEVSMKTWLGPWGGRLMVNKNTWYAHWHKGWDRSFYVHPGETTRSYEWTANYWMGNKWKERVHDIDWLIDRFWPVRSWPDNWKQLYAEWKAKNEN